MLARTKVPGISNAVPRTPHPERLFHSDAGDLVLTGRESIGSWFEQSLVARRQEYLTYTAETYQHGAGLTTHYNRHKFHALILSFEPEIGRSLTIMPCPVGYPDCELTFPLKGPVPDGPLRMRVKVDHAVQRFYWASGDGGWQPIGGSLDATLINGEAGPGEHGSFAGAFVGMIAYDITGHGREARFECFTYIPMG
ncbi:MAG: xylan 1,4-beta-xylosidase [Paracoccaceae bacterium]|jgi:xylan 1,4-beta-xylosidase